MKYAVIKVSNGNFFIHAEGFTSLDSSKVSFHGLCQALWNAPDVITGAAMIVNENLEIVEGYKERISHPVAAPEPAENA